MKQSVIKKVLRKWLKKKVISHIGAFNPHAKEYFEWIYNAPVREWKDRLWCLSFAERASDLDKVLLLLNE